MKRIMKLHGLYGQGLCTLVDEQDYSWANQYEWTLTCFGAVVGSVILVPGEKAKSVRIARMIMNFPALKKIHHLDENTLNNTTSNLIIVTSKEHGRYHTLPPFAQKTYLSDVECVLQMLEKYRDELYEDDIHMALEYLKKVPSYKLN